MIYPTLITDTNHFLNRHCTLALVYLTKSLREKRGKTLLFLQFTTQKHTPLQIVFVCVCILCCLCGTSNCLSVTTHTNRQGPLFGGNKRLCSSNVQCQSSVLCVYGCELEEAEDLCRGPDSRIDSCLAKAFSFLQLFIHKPGPVCGKSLYFNCPHTSTGQKPFILASFSCTGQKPLF